MEALEFWGDLMTKYKAVVPDAITWEFEEIIAGGQSDRYAMAVTFAPYGTLINDPKISKTGGKWAWAHGARATVEGGGPHLVRRPDASACRSKQEQGMGIGIHPDGCSEEWHAAVDAARQCAAAASRC